MAWATCARCSPRRHGLRTKPFTAYEPGYLHVDVRYLPQTADENRRRYLFVAIDRATRGVFVRIYPARPAAKARRLFHGIWSAPRR